MARARRFVASFVGAVALLTQLPAPPSVGSPPEPARVVVPTHKSAPRGGTNTYRAGLQRSNSGAQLAENIPAEVRRSWSVSPAVGACSKQVGSEYETPATVTTGKYTVALHAGRCDFLTAYRTSSGKKLWSKRFFSWSRIVSDGTYVYIVDHSIPNDDFHVSSYKISSGKRRWRSQHLFTTLDLAVGSGVVVNDGVVLDARTGKLKFRLPLDVQASSSPYSLVVGKVIYRNTSRAVEAYTVGGQHLWTQVKPDDRSGDGREEDFPQYHDGKLYITSSFVEKPTLVLDATTGQQLRTLPPSTSPLAIDGHVAVFTRTDRGPLVDGSYTGPYTPMMSAVDLEDGYVYWTHAYRPVRPAQGATELNTPPVIENGLVWSVLEEHPDAQTSLVALDEATGEQRSRQQLVCTLEHHLDTEASGTIGVAQHRLFVPGTCGLQTFVAA